MKLKGLHFADVAEIQEAVIKDGPKKRNFRQVFRKLYDRAKACTYANWSLF
jgi:hypothetical protein